MCWKPSPVRLGRLGLLLMILSSGLGSSAGIAAQTRAGPGETVTFHRDIAPILDEHCVGCHRPTSVAPFGLGSYAEVRPRARRIARVTRERRMPPWKPTSEPGQFLGERRLDAHEVELIQRWVARGAPEGDPRHRSRPRSRTDGWMRGRPDLVVEMAEAYELSPEGEDVYRNFVLPIPVETRRFVQAIELRGDSTRGIHHARIMVDRSGSARRRDDEDPGPGYDNEHADRARFPEGHFLGWAPGTVAHEPSDRLAWAVEPGMDLVLKTHLVPRGRPTRVQVSVGFFFSESPPSARAAVLHLGSQTIDVPPGASHHPVEDSYQLPVDVDVLAIYPHAHFLGKEVLVDAILPDGAEKRLLSIEDWDFAWQDEYRYTRPVRLPAGSVITMRFVFDNSRANPHNPSQPPRRVRFGPRSTDEMAEVMLQVVPVEPSDVSELARSVADKVAEIVLAGSLKALAEAPQDAVLHERAGNDLVAVGRMREAVDHLETSVRLDPARPSAHYRLGTARAMMGRSEAAMVAYRRALALRPDFVEAHNNLGGLLQLAGHLGEAARHYRRTLALDPTHANAHFNLGSILVAQRRYSAGEVAFRAALAARPDFVDAHVGLGLALASQGHREAAADAFRSALRLEPGHAEARRRLNDTLQALARRRDTGSRPERARPLDLRPR